jgi:hypothetical protein
MSSPERIFLRLTTFRKRLTKSFRRLFIAGKRLTKDHRRRPKPEAVCSLSESI